MSVVTTAIKIPAGFSSGNKISLTSHFIMRIALGVVYRFNLMGLINLFRKIVSLNVNFCNLGIGRIILEFLAGLSGGEIRIRFYYWLLSPWKFFGVRLYNFLDLTHPSFSLP